MNKIEFGKNQFCGPSVISAICSISTDEAAAVLADITGKREIKGIRDLDLVEALKRLGWKSTKQYMVGRTTLFNTLLSLQPGLYILVVPGHYIAIESTKTSRILVDNRTKTPINAAMSARLSQKVHTIIKVDKMEI